MKRDAIKNTREGTYFDPRERLLEIVGVQASERFCRQIVKVGGILHHGLSKRSLKKLGSNPKIMQVTAEGRAITMAASLQRLVRSLPL